MLPPTETSNQTAKPTCHPAIRLSIYVLTCWLVTGIVFCLSFASAWTEYGNGFLVGMFHWAIMAIMVLPLMFVVLGAAFFFTRRNKYRASIMRLLTGGLPLLFLCATAISLLVRPLSA